MRLKAQLFVALILFLNSCTTTSEFIFKDNYSGKFSLLVDCSKAFEGESALNDNAFNGMFKDSIFDKLKRIDTLGLRNIHFEWNDSIKVFNFKFEFDRLETLNKVLTNNFKEQSDNLAQEAIENNTPFEIVGNKKLKANLFIDPNRKIDISYKQHKYIYIYKFSREIKKVNHPKVKISRNRKQAKLSTNLYEIYKPDYQRIILFKFK